MSIITYPLNDTEYQAEDAELFHCTRSSGIYSGGDFGYSVTGEDNSVTVEPGIGWIRNSQFSGKVVAQKEAETLDLGLPDSNLPRWDVVAIQFSKSLNLTGFVVKQGAASSSPVLPEISRTELVYELYICKVYRAAGAAAITAADITDLRLDPAYCGIMADSVTSVDTRGIASQVATLLERLQAEIDGINAGTEVMLKTVYDTDNSGSVENSKKLAGQLPSAYSMVPAVLTALPASGTALADNTIYNVAATVGTYKFVAPASGWAHGTFTTGTSVAITFETGAKFLGSVPEFGSGVTYEFDVFNGTWVFSEVI